MGHLVLGHRDGITNELFYLVDHYGWVGLSNFTLLIFLQVGHSDKLQAGYKKL